MRVPVAPVLALFALLAAGTPPAQAAEGKIAVVAAENFYGDIAKQIGGDRVAVLSIINSPDQDPHHFEPGPGVVRQIADAKLVIYNGGHYDEWMGKLIAAAPRPGRTVINASRLIGAKHKDNPHVWYRPATMPAVAKAIADALTKADAANAAAYASGLATTLASLEEIERRVAEMRAKHAGAVVAASEPVFGPMIDALGLTVRNQRFQLAVMNHKEPSARDVAAFETDLKTNKVKVLIYNKQVADKLSQRMVTIANQAKVPVVAVTETLPTGMTFQDWMISQLDALDKALSAPNA